MDSATYILTVIDKALAGSIQKIFISLSGYLALYATDIIIIALIMTVFLFLTRLATPDLEEVFKTFLKFTAVTVLAANFTIYTIFIDVFTQAPGEIAASILSTMSPSYSNMTSINQLLGAVLDNGLDLVGKSMKAFNWGAGIITGLIILVGTIINVVGLLFIIGISKIMLSIMLGFAPLFLYLLLFKSTGKMFELWLQQIMNYALLPLFAYAISLVTLPMANDAINSSDLLVSWSMAGIFLIISFLNILALKQVATVVSGISGGMAVSDERGARRTMKNTVQWGGKKLFGNSKNKLLPV